LFVPRCALHSGRRQRGRPLRGGCFGPAEAGPFRFEVGAKIGGANPLIAKYAMNGAPDLLWLIKDGAPGLSLVSCIRGIMR
jgi:hypothetical protein